MNDPVIQLAPIDRFAIYLHRALLVVGIVTLAAVTWFAGEAALTMRSTRSTVATVNKDLVPKAEKMLADGQDLTGRVNSFITPDELRNLKNNLDTSVLTGQQTANAYSAVADATVTTMEKHVQPAIDDFRQRGNKQIDETTLLTAELRKQIQQNGDSAKALLDEGRVTIAQSKEQVVAILKELNSTTHGLSVITNDPQITEAIHNLNESSANLAGTSKNIEVITTDLNGLSAHFLRPLYTPQKRSFFGKIGAGTLQVFRYVTGAGNLAYIISKF